MATMQTEFTEAELLADHQIVEPLIADGVRCHGGFDEEGRYVSPRPSTGGRPSRRGRTSGSRSSPLRILDVPLETWPENFPNVEQSKFLIGHGAPGPTISAPHPHRRRSEGFGAMLRHLPVPDFQRCFDEDITGTAIAHIDGGLFEAHARDESGFGELAGHDRMWFVARDIAFEHPVDRGPDRPDAGPHGHRPDAQDGRPDWPTRRARPWSDGSCPMTSTSPWRRWSAG